MRHCITLLMLTGCLMISVQAAEHAGRVQLLEGSASIMRSGAEQWRNIRPNMPVRIGDQIYTREESFVEIRLKNGAMMRMDEKTKVVIEHSTEDETKTTSSLGNVWVNMRKLVNSGKEFELSSPTATAAIRGTVFHMETARDSSTDVSVYSGKVAVGPTRGRGSDSRGQQSHGEERVEVPGPEEIPGPYEVSLEEWRMIIAGQRISIRRDGKYAQAAFDAKSAQNRFVKRNRELDRQLESEQD